MIFDDLDSSITFKELAEMIMERELSDKFSYDWFCYVNENDDYDEQKIEGARGLAGNLKLGGLEIFFQRITEEIF